MRLNIWFSQTIVLACVILPVAQAQHSQPKVAGRITEAVTGVPVEAADVTLHLSAYGAGRSYTVRTDGKGNYSFDDVPSGAYFVGASKEGFVARSYKRGGDIPFEDGLLRVDATNHLQGIDIQLHHEALIRGTVAYTTGQPAVGVPVAIVPRDYVIPVVVHLVPTTSTKTDANGQFVLRGIAAGTYFVCVNGPAGYSYYDTPHDKGVWYHETWYGGTDSYPGASTVTLKEGEERTGVRIAVTTEYRYNVIVRPSGPDGEPSPDRYSVAIQRRNQGVNQRSDGSYVIPAIPPGHYTVVVTAWSQSQYVGMGEQSFDVTSADMEVHMRLGGLGEIGGTVGWAGEPAAVLDSPVFGIGSEGGAAQGVRVDAQGHFNISRVLPGRYRFQSFPYRPPAIVVRVECGGRQITQEAPLVVGDRENIPDCKVTLRKP